MSILTIQDFRDEGYDIVDYSDVVVQRAIDRIEDHIADITNNIFETTTLTLNLDGEDRLDLRLPYPIISISSIKVWGSEIALADTVVYNRHLFGMLNPDDRDNPRVEFKGDIKDNYYKYSYTHPQKYHPARRWPNGVQNIEVVGSFGYRDYNRSEPDPLNPIGKLPSTLRTVAFLLVPRYLDGFRESCGFGAWKQHHVTRIKTRNQEIELGGVMTSGKVYGDLTGDLEIDRMLSRFIMPSRGYIV